MKRWMAALLLGAMGLAVIGCGGGVKDQVAVLETDFGEIVLAFYPDVAPEHVANFKRLAEEGVYDGVLWHRVVPGFVIQSGDPSTALPDTPPGKYGSGGTDQNLKAEFNTLKHLRGTLGMARSADPNSADSQFYICLTDIPHLDRKYTVFGEVVSGMDVVDKIAAVETGPRDIPLQPVHIKTVRITTWREAEIPKERMKPVFKKNKEGELIGG